MPISKPLASVVIALTGTNLPEAVVTAIIDDAALMATSCLEALDADLQEAALKWLAAHLIASTDKNASLSSRRLGDASKSYSRAQLGTGIAGTTYGQQAIALVPCLARLGRATASIERI